MICELLGQWLLLKSSTFCFLRFGTDFEGFWRNSGVSMLLAIWKGLENITGSFSKGYSWGAALLM